jgi:hypothetical protein
VNSGLTNYFHTSSLPVSNDPHTKNLDILLVRGFAINYQLSIINYQLSIN